jgi:hypothetical protein
MRLRVVGWGVVLCAVLAATSARSQVDDDDNPLGLSTLETKDLKLVWVDSLGHLSPHAARTFANALAWQRQRLGWSPSQPVVILLKDQADYGNASASVAPRNRLVFDVAPLSLAFETFPAAERFYSLMNHEVVHLAQGDLANDDDRRWRALFAGKVWPQSEHPESLLYSWLTIPRFTAPRWYIEGSAVFLETWMGGGLGRAQGGYDEMVFRAMVSDGARLYDPLGLASRGVRDFQHVANAYLYGTRFMSWLALTYGPNQVLAWIRRDEGSERAYDAQFEKVFGRTLESAWADWIVFERDTMQRANLEEVRKFPITTERRLAATPVGSISRLHYDEATGTLLGAFRYAGQLEHVGAIDTTDGSVRKLADLRRAMLYKVAAVAWDPSASTLYYTNDSLAQRDLMSVDVKTGEVRTLFADARIGDLAFNPIDRSLWGVRHESGLAALVRLEPPYDTWNRVVAFEYGYVPYDLDISRDGKRLSASVAEVSGNQYLRVWDLDGLRAGDVVPRAQFLFGQSVPESFVFSKDGRFLFGSSYYTGVSNIFRFDVDRGVMEAVSNADVGYFRPVPIGDDKLVVLSYTSAGFVPAVIDAVPLKDVSAIRFLGSEVVAKHPDLASWQVAAASEVDLDRAVTKRGAYRPWGQLGVDNVFPVLQGYKNSIGAGLRVNLADPLGFANVGIVVAGTPDGDLARDERAHLAVDVRYLQWRARAAWNRSDFYDLFGPTKVSRRGLALEGGVDASIISDDPRRLTFKLDVGYYDRIERLPDFQNIASRGDNMVTARAAFFWSDVRRSIGAVDDEKGTTGTLVATLNNMDGESAALFRADAAIGWALPADNASVWLRGSAGASTGKSYDPAAFFYFGAFGNNYVDNGPVRRYRDWYAYPGFDLQEIQGRSFVRPLVEVNSSPFVFERAGIASFHASWLRAAVFASALWTDPDRPSIRRDYANAGVQLDLRFSLMHWHELTLSLGYAAGFARGKHAGDEWMVSLKVL